MTLSPFHRELILLIARGTSAKLCLLRYCPSRSWFVKGRMMHDVVIIGGGHNGLVCSAYLAMAGLKVLVLDQRPVAGGAAVTEEFSPDFRNSVASYAVSLLDLLHNLVLTKG
jgi:NADPH-dependent 2,4-dienoyl-CoA reductase/sulfur reductase-like enzyme